MKLKIAFVVFLTSWFAFAYNAESFGVNAGGGSDAGNGGGVICVAGVCKTLVEAGLRLSPEFNGVWLPSDSHYSLVEQRINNRVALPQPTKTQLLSRVFGRSDHFRSVNVIDPSKLEAIKELYKKVALDSGFTFDPTKFTIVAFSSDNTVQAPPPPEPPQEPMTYLLPEFFQLSPSQQAQILIHEGLYRGQPTGLLKPILQFETAIEESIDIDGAIGCVIKNSVRNCINQHVIGYRLNLISKSNLIMMLLHLTAVRSADVTSKNDYYDSRSIATSLKRNDEGYLEVKLNPIALTKLGKVDNRIPFMFSKINQLVFERIISSAASTGHFRDLFFCTWQTGVCGIVSDITKPSDQYYYNHKLINADALDLLLPE